MQSPLMKQRKKSHNSETLLFAFLFLIIYLII